VVRFLKGNHKDTKNTKITKDQQRIAHFHRRWRVDGRMSNSLEIRIAEKAVIGGTRLI